MGIDIKQDESRAGQRSRKCAAHVLGNAAEFLAAEHILFGLQCLFRAITLGSATSRFAPRNVFLALFFHRRQPCVHGVRSRSAFPLLTLCHCSCRDPCFFPASGIRRSGYRQVQSFAKVRERPIAYSPLAAAVIRWARVRTAPAGSMPPPATGLISARYRLVRFPMPCHHAVNRGETTQ